MADFNGDGRQEIAVVYKGHNEDLPSGLDSALPNIYGVTVRRRLTQMRPTFRRRSTWLTTGKFRTSALMTPKSSITI
ncbi:MAG: hypothetical protein IJP88_04615, partial [Synergistaceae bacterium]|nr:hypothetical protein [Synergistaceae bacterium]